MSKRAESPETEHSERTPEEIIEDVKLRIGYCLMLRERAPFNEKEQNCSSEESAYFLDVEQDCLTLPPPHLQYPHIAMNIAEQYRPSIKIIWHELLRKKRALSQNVEGLQSSWDRTPWFATKNAKVKGKPIEQITNEYPQAIPKKHKKKKADFAQNSMFTIVTIWLL